MVAVVVSRVFLYAFDVAYVELQQQLEGAIHTAHNLGQLAAYFLQTGATQEATDFFMQAGLQVTKLQVTSYKLRPTSSCRPRRSLR